MKYHNYRESHELEESIVFCHEDAERCEHYGPIHRIFDSEKTEYLDNGEALELAIKFYEGEDYENVKSCVYPDDIVGSAGAWDDIDFINFLENKNYFAKYDAIITPDGAVVFNYELMEVIND